MTIEYQFLDYEPSTIALKNTTHGAFVDDNPLELRDTKNKIVASGYD